MLSKLASQYSDLSKFFFSLSQDRGTSLSAKCYSCETWFDDRSKLDLHFKVAHLKMVACYKCQSFANLFGPKLEQHLRTVHSNSDKTKAMKISVAAKDASPEKSKPVTSQEPMKMETEAPVTSSSESPVKDSPAQNVSGLVTTLMYQTVFKTDIGNDGDTANNVCDDDSDDDFDRFDCDDCWFNTESSDDLSRHLETRHLYSETEVSRLISDKQSKQAEKKQKLDRESKASRTIKICNDADFADCDVDSFKLSCGICGLRMKSLSAMENHLGEEYHFFPGSKMFCHRCKFTPANLREVESHGKVHDATFSLFRMKCMKCKLVTADAEQMLQHVRSMHPRLKPGANFDSKSMP